MNAVIYARYSLHNQAEISIEGQLKASYEYAKEHNFIVVGEYIDRAISGTNDNREQFQKMIKDSSNKEFQAVLVYQLDKFGRNNIESAINEIRLNENGISLFSVKEKDELSRIILKSIIKDICKSYSLESKN